jgi:hypothetical protein
MNLKSGFLLIFEIGGSTFYLSETNTLGRQQVVQLQWLSADGFG